MMIQFSTWLFKIYLILAASYIPNDTHVVLQSENGILGLVSYNKYVEIYG